MSVLTVDKGKAPSVSKGLLCGLKGRMPVRCSQPQSPCSVGTEREREGRGLPASVSHSDELVRSRAGLKQLITAEFLGGLILPLTCPLFKPWRFRSGRTRVSMFAKDKPSRAVVVPARQGRAGLGCRSRCCGEGCCRLRGALGADDYSWRVYHLCSFGSLGIFF